MGVLPQTSAIPEWYRIALGELGVTEVTGSAHNPLILRYRDRCGIDTSALPRDDETAWCAIFANYCLEVAGLAGSKSAMAMSFARSKNFIQLAAPKFGCVVVFWRGDRASGKGHVGFWSGEDDSAIYLLSGNSGRNGCVEIARYLRHGKVHGFIGYYEPSYNPTPTARDDDFGDVEMAFS